MQLKKQKIRIFNKIIKKGFERRAVLSALFFRFHVFSTKFLAILAKNAEKRLTILWKSSIIILHGYSDSRYNLAYRGRYAE